MEAASLVRTAVGLVLSLVVILSGQLAGGSSFGSDDCPLGCKEKCKSCTESEKVASKCCDSDDAQAKVVAECPCEHCTTAKCDADCKEDCKSTLKVATVKFVRPIVRSNEVACECSKQNCTDTACKGECQQCPATANTAITTKPPITVVTQPLCDECQSQVASTQSTTRKASVTRFVTNLVKSTGPQSAQLSFQGSCPHLKIGSVIVCGHKICTGTKCVEVEDTPIVGESCDKVPVVGDDEEQIIVVPAAPPLPPSFQFAVRSSEEDEDASPESVVRSSLRGTTIAMPATKVVEMLMTQTALTTRLEMTEQLMNEREAYAQHLQLLSERNAQLSAQLAALEVRNHATESLTASIVERAELAVRLSALESRTAVSSQPRSTLSTIQEDLSNIRHQIAILKRQQPMPIASTRFSLPLPGGYTTFAQPVQAYVPAYVPPAVPTIELPVETSEFTNELSQSQTAESRSETTLK